MSTRILCGIDQAKDQAKDQTTSDTRGCTARAGAVRSFAHGRCQRRATLKAGLHDAQPRAPPASRRRRGSTTRKSGGTGAEAQRPCGGQDDVSGRDPSFCSRRAASRSGGFRRCANRHAGAHRREQSHASVGLAHVVTHHRAPSTPKQASNNHSLAPRARRARPGYGAAHRARGPGRRSARTARWRGN